MGPIRRGEALTKRQKSVIISGQLKDDDNISFFPSYLIDRCSHQNF